jgi:putative endonuclease
MPNFHACLWSQKRPLLWHNNSSSDCHDERSEASALVRTPNELCFPEKRFSVYIMSSLSRRIYTGVTNNLFRRVTQHKSGEFKGFTQRYRINRLVYYERFQYVNNAIRREKQIKGMNRAKRAALIERNNPTWDDLAGDWESRCPPQALFNNKREQIPRPKRRRS